MIRVKVPATTANLGPGFDVLGMALDYCNEVAMAETKQGLSIQVSGEGEKFLPRTEANIVTQAANRVFRTVGYTPAGLQIHLTNRIPIARGMGSSAAAIVGGVVAANRLSGGHLSLDAMLDLANQLEGHPDNVTPALVGGMTISCLLGERVHYIKAAFPEKMRAVVAVPAFHLSTAEARRILPKEVSLQDAVFNVSRSSLLVAAILTGKTHLLPVVMDDRLHQPYRAKLIPGLDAVFAAAKQAGAAGVVISGSGPSVIAFSDGDIGAVGQAMQQAFAQAGVQSQIIQAPVNNQGAVITEE